MKEQFIIKPNYDGTYLVCDSHNHEVSTFRNYDEALLCLERMRFEPPVVKSSEEIKREERKTKLEKIFDFK